MKQVFVRVRTCGLLVSLVALALAVGCAKNPPPAPDYPVGDEYFQGRDFEYDFPELAEEVGEEAADESSEVEAPASGGETEPADEPATD